MTCWFGYVEYKRVFKGAELELVVKGRGQICPGSENKGWGWKMGNFPIRFFEFFFHARGFSGVVNLNLGSKSNIKCSEGWKIGVGKLENLHFFVLK